MVTAAAAQAIWRNKMRSALTMLGVFIGVAALITMVSVGQGANEAVRKEIARLGTNLVVVLPGAVNERWRSWWLGQRIDTDRADAQAIRREAPAVAQVAISSASRVRYGSPTRTGRPASRASAPNYPPDDKLADRRRARDYAGG